MTTDLVHSAIVGLDRTNETVDGFLELMGRERLRQHLVRQVEHNPRPLENGIATDEHTCSDTATQYLRMMLSGQHKPAIPELVIALAQDRLVVPVSLLPKLLKLGQTKPYWQPYLAFIIGKRGRWLGTQINNQNWNWTREWDWVLEDGVGLDWVMGFHADEFKGSFENYWQDREARRQARHFPIVWSDEHYDVVMTKMQQTFYYAGGEELQYIAYHVPLSQLADFYERIRPQQNGRFRANIMADIKANVDPIFAFRWRMLAALGKVTDG